MNGIDEVIPELPPEPNEPEVLVELCAGGVADVELAESFRLQRVELNTALPLGGLTPSAALMRTARTTFQGEIIAMVRPREGGFCYSEAEFRLILDEASSLVDLGADGLAVGFLLPDGSIDERRCDRFRHSLPRTSLVFHRAFDVIPDQLNAVRTLIDLGWNRILTSGRCRSAREGAEQIRQVAEKAAGQIEILAGAGICAENVGEVLSLTGLRQLHASCGALSHDVSMEANSALNFSAPGSQHGGSYQSTSRERLAALMHAVDQWLLENRDGILNDSTARS